ncbi:DUF6046 domain-containing protein [Hymenobacter sp. CRA2]|uniref:DUF6046 domain-containing protein n=1 Tax=Hymenobacter sp. CRA2 TaxID=1955620 RepID=UPI00098F749E|nr:DUF6046 domain-containing protein [Hymenobacter sp. CRA2]OON67811.1 hypothetical protein B0919_16635 [Hymenobacter sp. CRA2]
MQFNVNLRALAAEAFGYSALLRYAPPPHNNLGQTETRYLQERGREDLYGLPLPPDQEGTGLLGLPVFQRVQLGPQGQQLILDEPIVEINRDKIIVTTEIQGRDGTVKEYISQGDFQISIKGVLASDPKNGRYARRYPEDEVKALKRICDAPAALPITGRLFALFGIHNVVIKAVNWPTLPGFTNLQAYELTCLSDEAPELQF